MGVINTSLLGNCVSRNADLANRNTLLPLDDERNGKVHIDRISTTTFESEFLTGDELDRKSVGTSSFLYSGDRLSHPLS
jgi:hypothetical protein